MIRPVLASSSPTRRRMLQDAGLAFDVSPPSVDEAALKHEAQAKGQGPRAVAQALAAAKAAAVSARSPALVIGADQTLDLDGALFDKPGDLAGLRSHLLAFRGRRHRLHAAAAVAQHGVVVWEAVDTAVMHVRQFSDAFLEDYLQREGEGVLGCVGGYRLEGEGVQLFDEIEGLSSTVLGLPLLKLLGCLRSRGVLAS